MKRQVLAHQAPSGLEVTDVIVIAAATLTAAYHMMQRDEDFHNLAPDDFHPFERQVLALRLIRRLHELGLDVHVRPRAA